MLSKTVLRSKMGGAAQRALATTAEFQEERQEGWNKTAFIAGGSILAGLAYAIAKKKDSEAWLFRDDIGAPNGIKGYEEQVNSVGTMHGHMYWPSECSW